jgi:asparagine synthase (glutamine-hydrolysing)
MSGFAAVFHLDGARIDRAWLETMADFLTFRGPDGPEIRVSGSVGLCHTLLRTTSETDGHPQIPSLDGHVWIAGDVRIDDRESLIAKLPRTARDLKTACSAELILRAYEVWGEACVEHLLGDFSFVIWDGHQRRVFAARDHLGVKPLFYAQVGQCLLISNTIDCIRRIPIVSHEVDERAIGDFLLVGMNKYPDATFFAGIRRLPVAHRLTAGAEELRTERYWTLPIDEPVYYKRAGDYVDRLHELLRLAVRDRLPSGPLGVLMSGGLDSPLLAATAVQLGAPTSAFTSVFDRLIPDEERHYAGLAARHIGIPIYYTVKDDEPWGWEPGANPIHTPEPSTHPLSLVSDRQYHSEISTHARVFFFGDGPDVTLEYEWRPHLDYLIRQRRWVRLGRDLISDFRTYPRVPFFHRLPRMQRERNRPDWYLPAFPSWLNKEFESRMRLKERWEEIRADPILPHPTRPVAYSTFAGDFPMGWAENLDAGNTGAPADIVHPYWDVRLLRFLLTVPAVPWCREKYLIRTALRGLVPEAVRLRPKAPLAGLPYLERIRRSQYPELAPAPGLERYLSEIKITKVYRKFDQSREQIDQELRILGLQYWLLGL